MEQVEYLALNGLKYKEWEDAVRYGNEGNPVGIKKLTKRLEVSVVDAGDMSPKTEGTEEVAKVKKGPFGRPPKVEAPIEPEVETSMEN